MVCEECQKFYKGFPFPAPEQHLTPRPNNLLTRAFSISKTPLRDPSNHPVSFQQLSSFNQRPSLSSAPPCLFIGATSAVRGGLWGLGIGTVFGLGNSVSAYGVSLHAIQDASRSGLRMGGGFAAYSGVYSSTRCVLIKARGTHDMVNTLGAGAFTGALLSFIQVRGQYRLYQNHILSCTMTAAGFAFVFDMLQRV